MRSRTMSIVSAELEELRGRRPSFDFACKFRLIHQMHLHWILEFSTVRFKTVWFNWEKMSDNSDLLPIQLKSSLFLLTCRMGLAISLVAMEKEKVGWMTQLHSSFWLCLFFKIGCNLICRHVQVWYHVCPNRGRGCYNTRLKEDGGCTIWYNEKEVNRDGENLVNSKALLNFGSTESSHTQTFVPTSMT